MTTREISTGGTSPLSWRLVMLLMAICFLAHFNRVSMPVAGDLRIMAEYGIDPTRMGVIYSAFLVAYTLFMIPGGWLIDRRGPRLALQVVCLGSAMFVVLTGMIGVTTTSAALAVPEFLVVRSIMGLVSAPLHPAAANSVARGISVCRRSTANGLVTGAALLGIAASYTGFGFLIDQLGWSGAFIAAGTATAAIGLLWTAFMPAQPFAPLAVSPQTMPRNEPPSSTIRTGFFQRNKNLLLLTASYAAVGYFQYLFFYWMHYYFQEVLKLGDAESRRYATFPPLAMALCMPLGGWLSDRVQLLFGWRAARGGLAAAAMTSSAILLLLGVQATQPTWIVIWMSLALGVLGMLEGPFWVTAVEIGGRRGGLSAGIFNTGGNVGGIIAPIMTPWISDQLGYGWQTGLATGSAVCLIGAMFWWWINEPQTSDNRSASAEPVTTSSITIAATADAALKTSILNPAVNRAALI